MSEDKKLLAIIIGDGCVTQRGKIVMHHAIAQKEWALEKARILQALGFKLWVNEQEQFSYGKIRQFIKIETTVTSKGKKLRELFYRSGKKEIPLYFRTMEDKTKFLTIIH